MKVNIYCACALNCLPNSFWQPHNCGGIRHLPHMEHSSEVHCKVGLSGVSINAIVWGVCNAKCHWMWAKLAQANVFRLFQAHAHWTCPICTLLRDFPSLRISMQINKDNGYADQHKERNYLHKVTSILSEENVSIKGIWTQNQRAFSESWSTKTMHIWINSTSRSSLIPQLLWTKCFKTRDCSGLHGEWCNI